MKWRAIRDGYIDDRYVKAGQEFSTREGMVISWAIPVSKLGPPEIAPVTEEPQGEDDVAADVPQARSGKKRDKSKP